MQSLEKTVRLVIVLNLCYFGVEFLVALAIGSVSLFADSIDFLENASVSFLVGAALPWSARARARMGMVLAVIVLIPGIAILWTASQDFLGHGVPEALPLSLTGLGALVVNLVSAVLLARHRDHGGSLSRAAFLSARNDVLADIAIVGAGLVTARFPSHWPDLIVGIGIALMNADAAWTVWSIARREYAAAAS